MRPLYAFGGVAVMLAGFAAWAALSLPSTTAQEPPPPAPPPVEVPPDIKPPTLPANGIRPIPRPKIADEQFDQPSAPPRALPAEAGRVPALDKVEVPEIPGVKPATLPKMPADSPSGVKPTVFIPGADPDRESPKTNIINAGSSSPAPAVRQLSFQEPMVRLEWQGVSTIQVGAAAEFTLVARNISAIALHKVIVQVKVPTGAKVAGTEPKAEGTATVLMWDLGTMDAKQDKTVKMSFVPPEKGEMQCHAWVTITGAAAFKAEVREAKLAITSKAPQRIAAGEPVALAFVITNSGDHPANDVKLTLNGPPAIEVKSNSTNTIEVGTLAPGEAREVKAPIIAKASGTHKLDAVIQAAGGVKASTTLNIAAVKAQLDVAFNGPKLRYVDRKAVYSVKVTNSGDATANNVVVTHQVPSGFRFVTADAGGKFDLESKSIAWPVGDLGVGESREVKCELLAIAMGDNTHKVAVAAERGLRSDAALSTKIEALSAMTIEVTDSDDPVEVGTDTTYEVRISNVGSKDEADIRLTCSIPSQMKFKSARGPGKFEVVGGEITFEPLDKLPSRNEAVYRITLTAKEKGDAKFKASVTAKGHSEPMTRVESTKIYAD